VLWLWFLGYYKGGIFRNPRFVDAKNHDFTLLDCSPAIKLIGFEPWDYSNAGREKS